MAAQEHGIATLIKFCKAVWCADVSNSLLHPDAYLSDGLIKEILDKFSILKSVEAVANILAPYKQLWNQEHTLFAILTNLQMDFDSLAAEKKAENAAKQKAIMAAKVADTKDVESQESGDNYADDNGAMHVDEDTNNNARVSDVDITSDIAGPSHEVLAPIPKPKHISARRAPCAPVLGAKEVAAGYGPPPY
ncbi:hypothetical protein L208DRAFT_1375759 [Tricholoma matsutake]|nr:hypothetical protein L208DRAFT_1375759 [Tricholoma matsutake 945]